MEYDVSNDLKQVEWISIKKNNLNGRETRFLLLTDNKDGSCLPAIKVANSYQLLLLKITFV